MISFKTRAGFTVIEALVALLVSVLLLWIIVPVALVQFGFKEPSESVSLDSTGLAAIENSRQDDNGENKEANSNAADKTQAPTKASVPVVPDAAKR